MDGKIERASSVEGNLSELAEDVRSFDIKVQDTLSAIKAAGNDIYQRLEETHKEVQTLRGRLAQYVPFVIPQGVRCS